MHLRESRGPALAALLSLGVAGCVCGDAFASDPAPAAPQEAPKLWFQVGEELVYGVYWGVVNVGHSHATTTWEEWEGRRVLAIRFRTRSTPFLDRIYKVDDLVETLVDPVTFLPIQYTLNLREGRHRKHEVTRFDFEKQEATWENLLKDRRKTFPLGPDTRDIISFMYYMRSQELPRGERLNYRVMADDKVYDLFVNVGRSDRMEFERYGKVRSTRLDPEAAFEGIFVRKGKLTMWVSEDPRRLLTRMMATTPFANIRVNLEEVRGPGEDFWVQGRKADATSAAAAGWAETGPDEERTHHVN